MAFTLTNTSTVLRASPEAARHAQGLSLRTFLASLVTSASVFAVEVCLFILLKDRLKQVYHPRTYLVPEGERTGQHPSGTISWIPRMLKIPDRIILQHSGLDAFFFLRYIRTLFKIFTGLLIVVLPTLVPLNSLGGNDAAGEVHGLDRFSWANIGFNHTSFYWAHLMMALVEIVFICHTIYLELVFYVHVRKLYLKSPDHRLLESANTILVTDIPEKDLPVLESLYSIFPGGVRSIWINRDLSALLKKMQERRKLVTALEAAETTLIRSAVTSVYQRRRHEFTPPKKADNEGEEPLWKRYLEEKNRDHMYLPVNGWTWMPSIPFIGKRVDTIYHCLGELARLNQEITADQRELTELESSRRESSKYPRMKSAFIQFNLQSAAYMACQTLLTSNPLHLSARHVGVSTQETRWSSLCQQWWNRYTRTGLAWIAIASLLVTWAIPIAFTGFLSQITTIADSVPWLRWIDSAPAWLSGIIQGVLPQFILTVLTALLPMVLRLVTGWRGLSTETAVELSLQKCYFIFLFIQTFLTVSLSSSITAIAQDLIHGLDSAPTLLARNLPKASNYFFSYLTLQGLFMSAGVLLQAEGLIKWLILAPLIDRTPRQKWERQKKLPEIRWGTFYPLYTNLACIGLTYSVIAPLILLFSVLTFGLFWFVFRYNLLYVSAFPYDTGGRLYPNALKQLFTGIYTMELCLIGLFLSIRDDRGVFAGIGQAAIMMVATVATAIYQLLLGNAFAPILEYLPVSTDSRDDEEEKSKHYHSFAGAPDPLRRLVHICYGWMKPNKILPQDLQESIYELARNQLNVPNQRGYEHQAAHYRCPVVWIPKDHLGISEDEITRARVYVQDLRISNELAELDIKVRVEISQNAHNINVV